MYVCISMKVNKSNFYDIVKCKQPDGEQKKNQIVFIKFITTKKF